MTTTLLSEYAIIVDPKDNLAVVKNETVPGLELSMPDGREFRVRGVVLPGHRFAIEDISAGEFVLQYGQPIGTSLGIESGEAITLENMSNEVPVIRDLPVDL